MPSSKHRAEHGAPAAEAKPEGAKPEGERIAKRIARAGLCSRREAEAWILQGRVVVDGKKLSSPALVVGPSATILVDGKPLPAKEAPWRLASSGVSPDAIRSRVCASR